MTTIQRVAQIFGWIFIVLGVVGLVWPGGLSMTATMGPEQPRLFGIFPINLLHNVVHVALGAWGVLAARTWASAKSYALGAGTLYAILAVAGFFIPTFFGLVPIGGNVIWLHVLLAVVLIGFGATAREPTITVRDTTTTSV